MLAARQRLLRGCCGTLACRLALPYCFPPDGCSRQCRVFSCRTHYRRCSYCPASNCRAHCWRCSCLPRCRAPGCHAPCRASPLDFRAGLTRLGTHCACPCACRAYRTSLHACRTSLHARRASSCACCTWRARPCNRRASLRACRARLCARRASLHTSRAAYEPAMLPPAVAPVLLAMLVLYSGATTAREPYGALQCYAAVPPTFSPMLVCAAPAHKMEVTGGMKGAEVGGMMREQMLELSGKVVPAAKLHRM